MKTLRGIKATPRESEIIQGIISRKSYKEIASELGIKYKTLTVHMTNLFRKNGLAGRSDLIIFLLSK